MKLIGRLATWTGKVYKDVGKNVLEEEDARDGKRGSRFLVRLIIRLGLNGNGRNE